MKEKRDYLRRVHEEFVRTGGEGYQGDLWNQGSDLSGAGRKSTEQSRITTKTTGSQGRTKEG